MPYCPPPTTTRCDRQLNTIHLWVEIQRFLGPEDSAPLGCRVSSVPHPITLNRYFGKDARKGRNALFLTLHSSHICFRFF